MQRAVINPRLEPAASIVLYTAAVRLGLNFPANADEQAEWFFNPFAWQLIFFTGFALGRGWISVPLDSKPLLWGSILVLVAGLAISYPVFCFKCMWSCTLRIWFLAHCRQTNVGLLSYMPLLPFVYLSLVIV